MQSLYEFMEGKQIRVWHLAARVDSSLLKETDIVFEDGFVLQETELLYKVVKNKNNEVLIYKYLDLLDEMEKFYKKALKRQERLVPNGETVHHSG
jgi:hypothetical protein